MQVDGESFPFLNFTLQRLSTLAITPASRQEHEARGGYHEH